MRNAFAAEMTALAAGDERVVLLSADIGNRLFDAYKEQSAGRFFNCGVAEPNMISMAAGLAQCGFHPFAYTIASFITTRCLEQIRVDACYHRLPVVIVGTGAGLSYASNGGTHHSCEDIAILRVLPGMTVICPGDALEVRQAVRAAAGHDGPVYLRLGKKGEPQVHRVAPRFVIGKAIDVRPGRDVCLLGTGNLLPAAVETADRLAAEDVSARVVSFHTIKPLDEELLAEVFEEFRLVVTLEEHSRLGGFGGAVAEWISERPRRKGQLLRIGTDDRFLHEAGNQAYARQCYEITSADICRKIMETYQHISTGDVSTPLSSV